MTAVVYNGHGVNYPYALAWRDVTENGNRIPSRNGDTFERNPGVFNIETPRRRLVTCVGRPINVAFALAEVLWILQGRQDVTMLKFYNSRIDQWSDDGLSFNAPYGYRLRSTHGHDQIEDIVRTLIASPESRQAVLSVWHAPSDRGWDPAEGTAPDGSTSDDEWGGYWDPHVTADRACNVLAQPLIRDGIMTWLQVVRSNDLIWGVPYNFMQWMHMHEYIARRVGAEVGPYTHVSNSLHVYDFNRPEAVTHFDLYDLLGMDHAPMVVDRKALDAVYDMEEEIRIAPDARDLDERLARVSDRIGVYWTAVLQVLTAHRYYALQQDASCMHRLTNCLDPVLALTQAKFYYQNRWRKNSVDSDMVEGLVYQVTDNERTAEIVREWFDR